MGNILYRGELFNGSVTKEIKEAVKLSAIYGNALVRARTPVDTGRLKAAWQVKTLGNGLEWSNQTPYATFVEYGTKYMRPRQMLTNSVLDTSVYFEKQLAYRVGKALGAKLTASPAQPSYDSQGSIKFPRGRGFAQ